MSLLKLSSIESVMPSKHLIPCCPLLLLPSIDVTISKCELGQRGSWVAQTAKNLPVMPETWVQSLGQEDPLEKEMATHSSILAWKIPWTEEPGGLQSMGSQKVGHD